MSSICLWRFFEGSSPRPIAVPLGVMGLSQRPSRQGSRYSAEELPCLASVVRPGLPKFLGSFRNQHCSIPGKAKKMSQGSVVPASRRRPGSGTLRNIKVKGSQARVLLASVCPSPSDPRSPGTLSLLHLSFPLLFTRGEPTTLR